jgi:hypothetical protein
MSQNPKLPPSEQLDIAAFSKLFSHTANSYKYLFFLALLSIMEQREFDLEPIILQDAIVEMLVIAYNTQSKAWQLDKIRLSFGNKDVILSRFDEAIPEADWQLSGDDLQKAITTKMVSTIRDLKKFAPYRLIRPFFEDELKGIKSGEVNTKISNLSREQFLTQKPLYRLDSNGISINFHTDWLDYLKANYSQVKRWTLVQWLIYIQHHNPMAKTPSSFISH